MPAKLSKSPFDPKFSGIDLGRILVPTDFSDTSRQALPIATEFAREFGAAITLVHVVSATLPAELSHIGIVLEQHRLASEARRRLDRFRECELPADLPVQTVVLEGGPSYEIARLAKEVAAGLIVTATHGHTGLKHVWLGSTAERIVRHAPCPVLVVREKPVPMRFPGESSCRFRRIVVPTDFSEASHKAIRYAASFARQCGSEAFLVHVIEPPPYPQFGYAHIPMKEAKLKKAARQHLDILCGELSDAGIAVSSDIRLGSAYREIADYSGEHGADLIVIATHGRGTIAHALLGSTAERVVRHASCPVLVVREHEREFVAD